MSVLAAFLATLGAPHVSLATTGVSSFGGGTQTATFRLESDGDEVNVNNLGTTDVGDWIAPKGAAPGAYEARVTVNSGTLSSGTSGSWLALTSTRSWSVSQTGAGTKSANITVEIRLGATVLASATFNLVAEAI